MTLRTPFSALLILFVAGGLRAQNLQILNPSPAPNQNHLPPNAAILVRIDQPIVGSTLDSGTQIVRGSQSGLLQGGLGGGGDTTISFGPTVPMRLGGEVTLTLVAGLLSETAENLPRGLSHSFTVCSGPAPEDLLTLAPRPLSPGSGSGREIRAMDYDGDGDLDILAAHEGLPEQNYVYRNEGEPQFSAYSTGGSFRLLSIFDIDGNGDYDNFGAAGSFDTELNWFKTLGAPPFIEHLISSENLWTIAGRNLDSNRSSWLLQCDRSAGPYSAG